MHKVRETIREFKIQTTEVKMMKGNFQLSILPFFSLWFCLCEICNWGRIASCVTTNFWKPAPVEFMSQRGVLSVREGGDWHAPRVNQDGCSFIEKKQYITLYNCTKD